MAQRATTRSSAERSQVQVQQATGAHRSSEAHSDGARGTKEAASPRSGEVATPLILYENHRHFVCVQVASALSECQSRIGGATKPGAYSYGETRAEWGTDHQSEQY